MADNWDESVDRLIRVFGGESASTLGAAVFQSPSSVSSAELEPFAFSCYKHFVGKSWEAFGEENWSRSWALLHQRASDTPPKIMQELAGISDPSDPATSLAASQLTENHDSPSDAAQALESVFNAPEIQELRFYRAGDSDAITGLVIAARTASNQAITLVFLMD